MKICLELDVYNENSHSEAFKIYLHIRQILTVGLEA